MGEEHTEQSGESHGGGGHGAGGHGGAHEEHEGAPEWLISFADNVALLMGFFVILLAMNMAKRTMGGIGGEAEMGGSPNDPMMEFVLSVRDAFNTPVALDSKDPKDQELVRYLLRKRGASLEEGPAGRNNRLQSLATGEVHRTAAMVTFDDREAALSGDARRMLAGTADTLKGQTWIIEVRGYVSPFEVMRNPTRARDLSYQRAMSVASALVESGLRWESLRVVSCGDAARLVPRAGSNEEDRPNQRVEVIVTNEVLPADPYAKPRDGTGGESAEGHAGASEPGR